MRGKVALYNTMTPGNLYISNCELYQNAPMVKVSFLPTHDPSSAYVYLKRKDRDKNIFLYLGDVVISARICPDTWITINCMRLLFKDKILVIKKEFLYCFERVKKS